MRVIVLSSGSKGNTTYIETDKIRILIDAGNSCKYIENSLLQNNIDPHSISAILITHTHYDHIYGLKTLIKKYNPTIYVRRKMLRILNYLNNYIIVEGDNFQIEDLNITLIKTSHDSEDSIGFLLENSNRTLVYITDTGYINERYHEELSNKNIYIFESNHDIEMLMNGAYDLRTKKRILSDKGHLSNEDAAKYLCKFIGNDTKCIMLAHLSENNNTEDLAYQTLINKLKKNNIEFHNIKILKQNTINEEVTL